MSGKKLLFFGNANHQFNTNYVKWLRKKSEEINIDFVSDKPVTGEASSYYNNVTQVDFHSTSYKLIKQVRGFRRIYTLLLFAFKVKGISRYDYLHIQILSVPASYFALFANKFFKAKIIISIWGSDYYKCKKKNRKVFINACKVANKITFSNEQTKNHFISDFQWRKNNLFVCRFGLEPLETLKTLNVNDRNKAKKSLGWNANKLAITIGYNLDPFQQHIKILDEFNKIEKYADRIEIILPITYHGTKKYKDEILSKLEEMPFDYIVYDHFLSDEKVARLRLASDVMIQLQVTDQFSGSMQEHLFARNVVITGSWLPYQTMIDHGVELNRIDDVEDLANVLESVLDRYDHFYAKTEKNPQTILNLSSWDSNISHWLKLYE